MADVASQWANNPQYQGRIAYYRPLLAQAAQQYGLPPQAVPVMESILGVESRFGTAKGLNRPGAAGELGILQQTPAFREQYGVTNPLDDSQQIDALARYFRDESSRGAPLELIPAGYNAGSSRLRKLVSGGLSQEQLPAITQRYLSAVRNYIGSPGNNGGQIAQAINGRSPAVSRMLQSMGLPTQRPVQPLDNTGLAAAMTYTPQDYSNPAAPSAPLGDGLFGGQTGMVGARSAASAADIDSILGEYRDARV